MRSRLKKLVLFLGSLVLFLGIAELLWRLLASPAYYVWPPGFERTARVHEAVRGIDGDSRLTINSLGMRGDEPSDRDRYRLLTIGGSTTICAYLDDSEAWPYLVQERLNAVLGAHSVWVGNVGRAGHTTHQHQLQVEKLLPQLTDIDGILLLVGINDMLAVVGRMLEMRTGEVDRTVRNPDSGREAALRIAFSVVPPLEGGPWYERTFLARVWRLHSGRPAVLPFGLPEQDEVGRLFLRGREQRRHAGSFHPLPELAPLLDGYARNLHRIIDTAEGRGVRVIFLTQPTLWREDLSEEERDLLWMGGPPLHKSRPGAAYYTVEALAAGMKRYNEALLEVCRERRVECIDAAEALPRDATVFWDDAHFTERGARLLANVVAQHLLRTEPLKRMERRAGSG